MVLPVRIELTTSPLPRGCSTTELRQRDAAPSATEGRPEIATWGLAAQEQARIEHDLFEHDVYEERSSVGTAPRAIGQRSSADEGPLALPWLSAGGYAYCMTGRGGQVQDLGRGSRAERLAAALRQNMKRRKAQARARAQAQEAGKGASHDSAGIVPEKSKD
jgi:hypothetical protein